MTQDKENAEKVTLCRAAKDVVDVVAWTLQLYQVWEWHFHIKTKIKKG